MTKLYNMFSNAKEKLQNGLKNSLKNKKGQGMVEYVLIIAFIAIVVMVALGPLGKAVAAKFDYVKTNLTTPTSGTTTTTTTTTP